MHKTVAYGENGPKGLLPQKKVVVITSRGDLSGQGHSPQNLIIRSRTSATFWDSLD
jgi:FMN-dependent NADH-azoreductase